MTWLTDLYATHPFWIWLAIGGLFLAVEVATGTGWLLWTAASAAVVAVLTFVLPDNALVHLTVWAVLTIVSTVTARRFLPRNLSGDGPDINDNVGRLVGREGAVVEAFRNGQGRVFVDGKEWAAVADDGGAPKLDEKVQVVSAAGSVLHVKAA
jgi:membrane protein implicated in regulation of membrane protease activity